MSRLMTIQDKLQGRTGRPLSATKEDKIRTKISGTRGGCWEDILGGNEGEWLEAGGFCSRGDKGGTIHFLKYLCCS